eukprot:TRINITY_DN16795_c0_g1_i1.p1 TRINITY_DN16795_c0_g1~~TRINITY_DN16795_c0_g1_i1.p1  ORF type:complete len:359 (+),score=89.49 TRINITY_DN16795_c0_g1_i1:84-1079(+)
MSWYVDRNGRQVWVDKEETVYTVDEPAEDMPTQALTYLARETKQAVYAEHIIDEEDAKGRKKDPGAGARRGFVVRVDNADDRTRVTSLFQATVDKLFDAGVISRVDVDDSGNSKKAKRKRNKNKDTSSPLDAAAAALAAEEAKEEEDPYAMAPVNLAVNECNLRIVAKCNHFAHGAGFRVDVSEPGGTRQRTYLFTGKQAVSPQDFHKRLVDAVVTTGSRAMDGSMTDAPVDKTAEERHAERENARAQKDEDDWLSQMMGNCMVDKDAERQKREEEREKAAKERAEKRGEPAKPRDLSAVPPWMQTTRRRPKKDKEEPKAATNGYPEESGG